jgi:hypothetical protein
MENLLKGRWQWLVVFWVAAQAAAFGSLPENFDRLTGREKQTFLFSQRIVATEYDQTPSLSLGFLYDLVKGDTFTSRQLAQTLTHVSDELPAQRRNLKVIHTFGTVAMFDFEPDQGSPYTGIFRGGSGLLRFSYAGPPHLIGNVPGLGLKFFVDGHPSENLVVMNKLNSQGRYTSVFQENFSNILPEPTGLIMTTIQALFEAVVGKGNGFHQGLSQLSHIDQQGTLEPKPKTPYRLVFKPTHLDGISARSRNDFRKDLASVPEGTAIYEVYAAETGEGVANLKIGRVVTRSRFVASDYGDHYLFFKHSAELIKPEFR